MFQILAGRQHYRLYTIHHIPSLKTLDFAKVSKSERDRAKRLAASAAGAALERTAQLEARQHHPAAAAAKTFVPGEGTTAEETFVTNFTSEQKQLIRQMVAEAQSPAEIEAIERSVQRGIFPKRKAPDTDDQDNTTTNTSLGNAAKKSRLDNE